MELDNWSTVIAIPEQGRKDKGKQARLDTLTPPPENFDFNTARQKGR